MSSTGIVTKWNVLDSMIFFVEKLISEVAAGVKDSRDELPEPEEMIVAATKELQKENDELKRYRIPGYLIEQGNRYACPSCRKEVSDMEGLKSNVIKYCDSCGKRIILPEKLSPYGMEYVNNLVEKEDMNTD